MHFTFSKGKTMFRKTLVNVGVAALLGGMALAAQAAPLSINLGFASGSVDLTVGATNQSNPAYVSARSGAFKGQAGASSPFNTSAFITYCVQLTQNFAVNTTYGDYSYNSGLSYFSGVLPQLAAGGATVVGRLETLFSSLGNNNAPSATQTATAAQRSAAIQLAVWEAIYEGTTNYGQVGGYTDGGGRFGANNSNPTAATTAVIEEAERILLNAINYGNSGGQKLFSVGVLKNTLQQDFIVLEGGGFQSGIPEPTSLALVFGALGALGYASRRRKPVGS